MHQLKIKCLLISLVFIREGKNTNDKLTLFQYKIRGEKYFYQNKTFKHVLIILNSN